MKIATSNNETGYTEELYNSKEEALQTISTAAVVMVLITLPTPLLATLNILFMLSVLLFSPPTLLSAEMCEGSTPSKVYNQGYAGIGLITTRYL